MENNLLGAQQETRLRVEELEDRSVRTGVAVGPAGLAGMTHCLVPPLHGTSVLFLFAVSCSRTANDHRGGQHMSGS